MFGKVQLLSCGKYLLLLNKFRLKEANQSNQRLVAVQVNTSIKLRVIAHCTFPKSRAAHGVQTSLPSSRGTDLLVQS